MIAGVPLEENWINRLKSDDFANLVNYQSEYREQALRYEVGEHSNFILVPMLNKAINQLIRWSPENIQGYTENLMSPAITEMQGLGYRIEERKWRSNHLFGVRLPDTIDKERLHQSLLRNRVSISFRGDAIRIAPNVYNDEIDVRKLLKAMKEPIFA